jgi:hypothetical protein
MLICFTAWLEKNQDTGLWSELLSSLSFTVACLIHATRPHVPVYDSAVIGDVVVINVTSTFLTMAAFYKPIRRYQVFFPALLAIMVCAVIAAFAPLIKGLVADPILQACVNAGKSQISPSTTAVVMPYKFPQDLQQYLTYPVFMLIFAGMWFFLWFQREQWADIRKVCQLRESA